MFYRYRSSLNTTERLELSLVGKPRLQLGYHYRDWEVTVDPPITNYREFVFPEIAEDRFPGFQCDYKGKEKEHIPDIFSQDYVTIISAKFREIITKVDPCEHQYTPVLFFDSLGEPIDRGEYYHLWVRKRLDIKDTGVKPDVNFSVGGNEFLGTVQNNIEIRKRVEQIPLWQSPVDLSNTYLNEDLFTALKNEKISGVEEYSEFAGKDEETIGHV